MSDWHSPILPHFAPAVSSVFLLLGLLTSAAPPMAHALPPIWEPSFGTPLGLGEDDVVTVPIASGSFPFAGATYGAGATFFVSSNGFLTLNDSDGSETCSATVDSFLQGKPRISPFGVSI